MNSLFVDRWWSVSYDGISNRNENIRCGTGYGELMSSRLSEEVNTIRYSTTLNITSHGGTDRQGALKGGTVVYYNRPLYCCLIDTSPLINIEATACRLSVIGHGILILVSVYLPPKKELLRSDLEALFALGDAVILFSDFNSKSTNRKCNYFNRNSRKMEALAKNLHFNIVTPLYPTHYPNNNNQRSDILNIAPMKGVALKLSCIEFLMCLNSDYRPVLMRLGSLIADCPPSTKTITNWQKVSAPLDEIDTPILNSFPNYIFSTNDIDNAIGALTNHIRIVVGSSNISSEI
ncbi:RNA-directed DNA polymerase from mobile element jockey [Eumeta japonica]|uniref:RNA-directed DNA polymerase from mobile element jockey n=1 Tax=Eumeta variegata TaxID=151549 RepID=A0A4C1YF61_EUMVA|nr:RNA-directed DNA polymerase from mobile element jockey [Eumeta japonica]